MSFPNGFCDSAMLLAAGTFVGILANRGTD
jgi:hypothetical protein